MSAQEKFPSSSVKSAFIERKEQEFIKKINAFSSRHRTYQVFRDFIALSARMISNQMVYFSQELEDEYLQTIKSYAKEEANLFAELYALVFSVLAQGNFTDFLGNCYMKLELGNDKHGQFFTPFHICQLLTMVSAGNDLAETLNNSQQKFIALSEPCCGAGAMIIAFAENMMNNHIDISQHLYVQGTDIDPMVAEMCYIQCTLLGIPAHIHIGDSLALQISRTYATPILRCYNWMSRLNAHFETGTIEPDSPDPITISPALDKAKVVKPIGKSEQIFLF
jgi:type I restriction-modification system DNA methylase subunit